jgi:FkbM family methyltransferase
LLADQIKKAAAFHARGERRLSALKSYSQNFEDVMLWRALNSVKEGFYIDIGAQDPLIDSVSRLFYERGWHGIHIEPTSTYCEALRNDRPDETVIQAAVSDVAGPLCFHEIPGTGISTGDDSIAESYRRSGNWIIKDTVVPAITLASLFEVANGRDIHWLKLDVEGFEPRVLAGGATIRRDHGY